MAGYSYAERAEPYSAENDLKMFREESVPDDMLSNGQLVELAKKVDRNQWTVEDIPLLTIVRSNKLTQDKIKNLPDTTLKRHLMTTVNGGRSRKKSRRRSKRRRSKRRR